MGTSVYPVVLIEPFPAEIGSLEGHLNGEPAFRNHVTGTNKHMR